MQRHVIQLAAMSAVAASFVIHGATAQEIKLPPTLAFTTYDTGTAGFNIAVGVGKILRRRSLVPASSPAR